MLAPLLSSLALASTSLAATTCNGHSELCSRSYANVTYIGAHDSYAVGTSLFANQAKPVTDQLVDGIRLLQLQTHKNNGDIHLCHTACNYLDDGTLSDYLGTVKSWADSNPNEVVTILITNPELIDVSEFGTAFEKAGLNGKAYKPSSATTAFADWPTLGTLIDAGTNVVVFMDSNADTSKVDYIIPEWGNIWEDPYNVVTTDWGCAVNRSNGETATQMYLINHYLDESLGSIGTMPDKANLKTTNGADSLNKHLGNCNSLYGRAPTFVLLNFYSSNGVEPFQWAAGLNGVSAPTNDVTTGNIDGSSSGSGSASGSASGGANTATAGVVSTTPNNPGSGAGKVAVPMAMVALVAGAASLF